MRSNAVLGLVRNHFEFTVESVDHDAEIDEDAVGAGDISLRLARGVAASHVAVEPVARGKPGCSLSDKESHVRPFLITSVR